MKKDIKQASRNFSGALFANIISVFVSAITILIIPKFFGLTEFSYWQLYIFYVSYVGFMHLGWADGVYLRFGGKYYKELDKRLLSSQFWLLTASQLIISIIFCLFAMYFVYDADKALILVLTGLSCLLVNTRTFLQFILLSTNRILTYSTNLILEKVLYVILIVVVILAGLMNYEYLLAADIFAKLVMLLVLCYICRDIVFEKMSNIGVAVKEAVANISVGIKLMIANIAGMLIIGVSRFSIERIWGVEKFGKVSLVLTVAYLVMVFISAMSIVIFPILKRTDESNLPKIYAVLRTVLMVVVLGALVLFYPVHYVLSLWLPDFADSLIYMALLFPLCIYEAKMTMLIATYLKALRKEKLILIINCLAVALSVVGAIIAALWLRNLTLTILMIVLVLALRAIIAEVLLAKIIPIKFKKDIALELTLTTVFILAGWFVGGLMGMFIYIISYVAYLLIKKSDIKKAMNLVRR